MAADRISRRQLAAAVGAALAPAALARQDEPKKPDATPLAQSAGALLEIVKLRHGKQLDAARLDQVRLALVTGLESSARLAKVTLSSSDEPAFVFQADLP